MVHDEVRREMRRILGSSEPVLFLDTRGKELFLEARRYYADASPGRTAIFQEGTARSEYFSHTRET
jgi:ATP-dependent Lhr-like helicase